ncbi:MAG: FAD-dependent oxidoreductase [Gammaproteobacteria bacterium]|nr:FAD-dependent oxidoreductase [Gammaproteobacteria bacterium]
MIRVAVIGGGIAGISAAWHLEKGGADVHLLEGKERLGGHTHTHSLAVRKGTVEVDTGFIVFNQTNYPNFSRWLKELGLTKLHSSMSFAVRDDVLGLEYGTANYRAALSNVAQLMKADYWKLWRDLIRFYRALRTGDVPNVTLGQYLVENEYSEAFKDGHIVPMCSALWSQPTEQSLTLSLRHVITFMRNHRMLQIASRPDWQVVDGGSSSYLAVFGSKFHGHISTNCDVVEVRRSEHGVVVFTNNTESTYDSVVLACHSDQALSLLSDSTVIEKAVLSQISFHRNQVFLHRDSSFMPRNRSCWSSWNIFREPNGDLSITYWMNRLQGLKCSEQIFVTLNPGHEPTSIDWQGIYHHPHFTQAALDAQEQWEDVSRCGIYFAGAYWGAGFHEDGFVSGMRCAEKILSGVG